MGLNQDLSNFRFGRVGQQPLSTERTRLLVVDRATGKMESMRFSDLPDIVKGYEVWANDSIGQHPYFKQQNFYAKNPGSYYPPTAGIPMTPALAARMDFHLLTLHTGCPSSQDTLNSCFTTGKTFMEPYCLPNAPGKATIALGTTVAKALESWSLSGRLIDSSDLFIRPGHKWLNVGMFLTNFHWSGESLLAMTCAFGGVELIREAHETAYRENYGFSDYGDRLLIK